MRTLWFIRGAATPEQIEYASEHGLTIRDRDAYIDGDFIETADAVMGDAPAAYVEAYGHADGATQEAVRPAAPKAKAPKAKA